MVAVSIDRGGPEKPLKFLQSIGVERLGLYQAKSTEITNSLNAFGMPTTVLIDREGREVGRLVGPAEWASVDAIRLLEAAVKG